VKDWKAVDYVTVREKRDVLLVGDGRACTTRVMIRDDTVTVNKDGNE
jgi:hypothetical protein